MSEQIALTRELMQPTDINTERWYRQARNLERMAKAALLVELSEKAHAKGNSQMQQQLVDLYLDYCAMVDEVYELGEILKHSENHNYQRECEITRLELVNQNLQKMNAELLKQIEI
jgi:hypothetical protein